MAKARDSLQFVGAQIGEHRIHFQNDRKFGLFTHCNAFPGKIVKIGPLANSCAAEVCHKSHNFAAPLEYF
jgi:hypothetical protein